MDYLIVFQLFIFIFSIIIHEISHGFVALKFGDTTAKDAGRLTLNPLPHLDLMGSIIFPFLFYYSAGFIFGWAKPVPINPLNLKDPRREGALIAAAGPLSNLSVALVIGLASQLVVVFYPGAEVAVDLLRRIVLINIFLAVFNLIPIPPVDGSRVLGAFLGPRGEAFMYNLERYGFLILIAFIFLGGIAFIVPIVNFLFRLFTGI